MRNIQNGKKKKTDLTPFFQHVLRLKHVKRAGWISRAQISNPESVADHSYSVCAISMALSDILGLNTERVMKMAILHDLPESIVGDFVPGEVTKKKKRGEETNAIETILQSIPPCIRSDYKGIWLEYLLNKTDIARLVPCSGISLRWRCKQGSMSAKATLNICSLSFWIFLKNT